MKGEELRSSGPQKLPIVHLSRAPIIDGRIAYRLIKDKNELRLLQ